MPLLIEELNPVSLGRVVNAKDDIAAGFYRKYGFRHTAPGGLELYLPLGRG